MPLLVATRQNRKNFVPAGNRTWVLRRANLVMEFAHVYYYFQIYDASDFSVLCTVISHRGERWLGGEFLALDRILVWTDEGKAYLYKLPSK
jgi:hypothetical protein